MRCGTVGVLMTLAERAESYHRVFPDWPPPRTDARWLDGVWVLGNDYRNKSPLYGAFPPGLLKRVFALFPDAKRVLHVFSGSLSYDQVSDAWSDTHSTVTHPIQLRLDNGVMKEAAMANPDVVCDAIELSKHVAKKSDLVIADPPYDPSDAVKYGVKLPNKRKVLAEIAKVTAPGGNLVWLDTSLPMFAKRDWSWWGAVAIVRSTNHRVRLLSMFEKT